MSNKMYSPKQVYNLGVAIISHFSTYNYSVDSAPDVIWLTNLSKIFDVFLTRVSIKKQKLLLKYLKDKNVLLYDHFVHYLTGYWAQSIGILADLRGMPINRIYLSKLSNSLNNVTNSVEKEKTKQYQDENVKEMLIDISKELDLVKTLISKLSSDHFEQNLKMNNMNSNILNGSNLEINSINSLVQDLKSQYQRIENLIQKPDITDKIHTASKAFDIIVNLLRNSGNISYSSALNAINNALGQDAIQTLFK